LSILTFYPWINSHDTDADAGRMDNSCRTSKREDRRSLLSSKLNSSEEGVRLTGSGHRQLIAKASRRCFQKKIMFALKSAARSRLLRISNVRSATCFALICARETVRRIEQGWVASLFRPSSVFRNGSPPIASAFYALWLLQPHFLATTG
jgi:hypothetical protein